MESPGQRYKGTTRCAYLPDSAEGRDLLRRLKMAFKCGLTFRVSTSLSTGHRNQVTWTSVPHKTSLRSRNDPHGFPNDAYFCNCNAALDALHVPPADECEHDSEAAGTGPDPLQLTSQQQLSSATVLPPSQELGQNHTTVQNLQGQPQQQQDVDLLGCFDLLPSVSFALPVAAASSCDILGQVGLDNPFGGSASSDIQQQHFPHVHVVGTSTSTPMAQQQQSSLAQHQQGDPSIPADIKEQSLPPAHQLATSSPARDQLVPQSGPGGPHFDNDLQQRRAAIPSDATAAAATTSSNAAGNRAAVPADSSTSATS